MSDNVIGYSGEYGFVKVLSVEGDGGHHEVVAAELDSVPPDVSKALVEIHAKLAESNDDMVLYDLEDGDVAVSEMGL